MMASYLVTGGCGFIGSHLVDRLTSRGHTVIVLDNLSTGKLANLNRDAQFVKGSICDAELVAKLMQQCDGCFHLAAVASVQESLIHWVDSNKTNLVGTITLLEAATNVNKIRPFSFVYASSAAVYGDKNNPPFKETDSLNPISPYAADKESCELQARIAGSLYQLPNAGLRFFNVYGERQSPNSAYSGVISIFLNQLRQGRSITIYGDGEQVRDFIYVKDIVTYLCMAMRDASTNSLVFNACNGEGTSVNQLVATLSDILGIHPEVVHTQSFKGDIRTSIGNNYLAKTTLKVRESIPLVEGLTRLCESLKLEIVRSSHAMRA
jgi:UDP-glucose 4-epimerase